MTLLGCVRLLPGGLLLLDMVRILLDYIALNSTDRLCIGAAAELGDITFNICM